MLSPQKVMVSSAFIVFLFTASRSAGSSVYVITSNQQSGTMDLATGTFSHTGSIPATIQYLVPSPTGSLLTMNFNGDLDSIDPITCGPNSANTIAGLGGAIYATDFANNLYSVNPSTGHTTLIGATGIPAAPFKPHTMNPDGSFNFFNEGLFAANGTLYAVFEAGTFNPTTGVATPVIADHLYRIDPTTGATTVIAPVTFGFETVVDVTGTFYAFNNATEEIARLDLTDGDTTAVGNFEPAAGIIDGAAATPEPTAAALAAIGLIGIIVHSMRKRLG